MKIGVLTSSRADFGIYLPLLKALKSDNEFEVKIIAFGTHFSSLHGNTLNEILDNKFDVNYKIESMLLTDSPNAISSSIGLTTLKFADFWKTHASLFDIVFCLGDRFEMLGAVLAGVPFQIKFAHIHGGETTLGAIDNVFRHSITLASKYHFVSTEKYLQRVTEIVSSSENIYNVGALSLDNLKSVELLSLEEFDKKFGIDLSIKTILITFHPETVAFEKNSEYADEVIKSISKLVDYQVLITMPNADTFGKLIREKFISNFNTSDRVFLIDHLGIKAYFTALKYCCFLLGNTSSGIIEAASFGKYVINLGDRQKGRLAGENVIHTKINCDSILTAVNKITKALSLSNKNIYYNDGAVSGILQVLKKINKVS